MKRFITLNEVQAEVERIACEVLGETGSGMGVWHRVYGVPRGGVPVAMMLAARLRGVLVASPNSATVLVDDIYDSGRTRLRHEQYGKPFYVAFDKTLTRYKSTWLVMPWEGKEEEDHSTDDIGTRLLQALGEDPTRGGLLETPKRWIKYMQECTSGMGQDPKALLKVFEDGGENVDEMVVVAGIPFYSMCEHHMAPFFGQAHIAYIPGTPLLDQEDFVTGQFKPAPGKTRIVGLSKIPRLLDLFAKRLQVQERITNQVAECLHKELGALGVGVVLRARHLCMEMRGVQKVGSVTYTSALRGAIKERPETRSEFLRFVEMADGRMGAL